MNLTLVAHPLPKFKDHLPKFSGNDTITTNEHLVAFSNAFHNIGVNDNDICMNLFVNSLVLKFFPYGNNWSTGLNRRMGNQKAQLIN